MQAQTYHYDFSYSFAFEKQNPICDAEKLLLACGHIIIRLKCFQNKDSQPIVAGLLRLPIYFKIGRCLLEICTVIHEFKTPSNKKEELQKTREQLYVHLQDLSRILSSDKQQYLPLIVVVYYISIKKVLMDYTQFPQSLDKCVFFHTIYWQLKGQMTTNKYLETLMEKTFKKDLLSQFQTLDLNQIKQLNKIDLSQSLSLNKKPNPQLLQSFKDIKLRRPDLIGKENLDYQGQAFGYIAKGENFKKKMPENEATKSMKYLLPMRIIK